MTALRSAMRRLGTAIADAWWFCVTVWDFLTTTDDHPSERGEGE